MLRRAMSGRPAYVAKCPRQSNIPFTPCSCDQRDGKLPDASDVYDASVEGGLDMARKYSRGASKDVEKEMHDFKRGKARSGKGGKGGKVKSRKQAIAIGLSKARKKGKKVPRKAA